MKKITQSNNMQFYLLDDPHAGALPLNISVMENIRIDLKHWRESANNRKIRSINIFAIQHFFQCEVQGNLKLRKDI